MLSDQPLCRGIAIRGSGLQKRFDDWTRFPANRGIPPLESSPESCLRIPLRIAITDYPVSPPLASRIRFSNQHTNCPNGRVLLSILDHASALCFADWLQSSRNSGDLYFSRGSTFLRDSLRTCVSPPSESPPSSSPLVPPCLSHRQVHISLL